MNRVEVTRVVELSIQDAFGYLVDSRNAPNVFRGMKEFRKISPGPLRAGSRLLAVRGEFNEEFVVTNLTPPTSYAIQGGIPGLDTEIRYHLEPYRDSTRLTLTFSWQLHGVRRLINPLLRRRVANEYDETITLLCQILETRSPPQNQDDPQCSTDTLHHLTAP